MLKNHACFEHLEMGLALLRGQHLVSTLNHRLQLQRMLHQTRIGSPSLRLHRRRGQIDARRQNWVIHSECSFLVEVVALIRVFSTSYPLVNLVPRSALPRGCRA